MKDYYKILGVDRQASTEQIKKAYRSLAKKYHPDVVKDDKAKQERMYEIQEAYACLENEERRKKYDAECLKSPRNTVNAGEKVKNGRTSFGEKSPDMDSSNGFSDFNPAGGWKLIRTIESQSRRGLSNPRKCLQPFSEEEACRRQKKEMRREAKGKRVKQTLDVLIILCGAGAVFLVFKEIGTWRFAPAVYFVIVIGMAAAIYDLFRLSGSKNTEEIMPEAERVQGIQRLILLDEEGKPIKSWDLQGKISLIIGKAGRDQELDIDLSDCEYSSFIDFQHAVLNFCLDQWYVEDLGSQNGVKVGKVEDGECYRVIHRPCKVVAGDVLYIANTKLLLT